MAAKINIITARKNHPEIRAELLRVVTTGQVKAVGYGPDHLELYDEDELVTRAWGYSGASGRTLAAFEDGIRDAKEIRERAERDRRLGM